MDRVFNSHTGAEDASMLAQARREVGLDGFEDDLGVSTPKDGWVTPEAKAEAQNHIETAPRGSQLC
jgi:hypothetical protein